MTPEQQAEKYANIHADIENASCNNDLQTLLYKAYLAGFNAASGWVKVVYLVVHQYDPICDCGHKSESEILGVFVDKQMAFNCAIESMSIEKINSPNIYREVYDKEGEDTENPLWIDGFLSNVNVFRYDLTPPQD